MRSLVVAALALSACDTPTGLYITARTAADNPFDHVDLHFGKELATQIPPDYDLSNVAPTQKVYVHDTYEDSVTSPDGRAVNALTYYVPSDFARDNTSTYVLAIAFKQGNAVAIGEGFKISVPTDEVHEHVIDLEPFNGEIWGASDRCIAWTHPRGDTPSTIAIVPTDDSECRPSVSTSSTCAKLAMTCAPGDLACLKVPCVTGGCQLGRCEPTGTTAFCRTDTCMASAWCGSVTPRCYVPTIGEDDIAGADTVDAFLACAKDAIAPEHLDFAVPHTSTGYCSLDLQVFLPPNLPCANPAILSPVTADIQISPISNSCILHLRLNGLLPPEQEHILFTVDYPGEAGYRTALTVGVHRGTFVPDCSQTVPAVSDVPQQYPVCVWP